MDRVNGGLEPGESGHWALAPNMFGNWGKVPKDRNDFVLDVSIISITFSDGGEIDASIFTEKEAIELKTPKDQH